MDLSKAFIIGVDYKDAERPLQWEQHLYAEIVLIDKTSSSTNPLLYQLKDTAIPLTDHFSFFNKGLLASPRDAFVFLGDVNIIDKKKKAIYLNNKNVITYNYLIIAAGTKPTLLGIMGEDEFAAGLQTLIEAIRVKQKISLCSSLKTSLISWTQRPHFVSCGSSELLHPKDFEKIVHAAINLEENNPPTLPSTGKRLYQVQI